MRRSDPTTICIATGVAVVLAGCASLVATGGSRTLSDIDAPAPGDDSDAGERATHRPDALPDAAPRALPSSSFTFVPERVTEAGDASRPSPRACPRASVWGRDDAYDVETIAVAFCVPGARDAGRPTDSNESPGCPPTAWSPRYRVTGRLEPGQTRPSRGGGAPPSDCCYSGCVMPGQRP